MASPPLSAIIVFLQTGGGGRGNITKSRLADLLSKNYVSFRQIVL